MGRDPGEEAAGPPGVTGRVEPVTSDGSVDGPVDEPGIDAAAELDGPVGPDAELHAAVTVTKRARTVLTTSPVEPGAVRRRGARPGPDLIRTPP